MWLLGLLCHFLCSNIIFPRVLNIASGVTQNNYWCRDDVKPLAIKTKCVGICQGLASGPLSALSDISKLIT